MSFYEEYHKQYGGGGRGINNVYVGSHRQRGHGLGSFFTGLFRQALPFLAKGARAIGKEALRAGVNILDDVGENNLSFKESFKNRINESGLNLKRKAAAKLDKIMEGSGYKRPSYRALGQYRAATGMRRISSKRRKKVVKQKRLQRKKKLKKTTKRRKNRKSKSVRGKSRKNNKNIDIFG